MSELEGTVFAGHRIEAVVGRGGMGVVYRATQLDLDRTVALKVIAAELLEDAPARRRFVQESRLAASIDHPHVIPIYAAGEQDGVPYLVMQYIAGDDARSLVRRGGPLAPARAARIAAQVAGALDAAHAAGLVHRDVKPANVLLATGDHAYLSDFGLTRHVRSVSGPTSSGHWVGTLDYVAPEQIRGGHVDARADVYALGCVLFFLLTGEVPFPRESDEARLWAHLTEPPPRVSPAAFDAVIRRALAKAPDDRYPSAGDLGRAAVSAAAGERVRVPERAVASGDAAPTEVPTRRSARPRARRRRAVLVLTAAVAVALAGFLVATAGDDGDPGRTAPMPSPAPAARGEPEVVARVPVGRRPNALARAGGRVWVGSFRSRTLDAIDPTTDLAVERLAPDVGSGTADIVFVGRRLWVATRTPEIVLIDPVNGRSAGTPIPLSMRPVMLAARGSDVVAGLESESGGVPFGQLLRLDATTGAVEASTDVAHGMAGAVYARGWLWTLHGDPNFIVRRHPQTLVAHQRIDLPGMTAGALAYGAGAFWATIPDQDRLMRYRPRSRELADVEVGARPVGVAVRGDRVWVAESGSSTLQRVDAGDLEKIGEPIRVPLNPLTLAAARDGIWVTCVGENVVARVDRPL